MSGEYISVRRCSGAEGVGETWSGLVGWRGGGSWSGWGGAGGGRRVDGGVVWCGVGYGSVVEGWWVCVCVCVWKGGRRWGGVRGFM